MNWLKRLLGSASPVFTPVSKSLTQEERERAIKEIDYYVQRDVAGGFRTRDDIITSATEVLADDFDPELIKPLVVERTDFHFTQLRDQETRWPAVTDCDRLDRAFVALENRGVVCRQDFTCCGTCGVAEIGDEIEKARKDGSLVRGYAFYHTQDTESAVEGHGVYLNYGATTEGELAAVRIGHEICDALRAEGLTPDWDGSIKVRIKVPMDWKRRRKPACRAT